MKKNKPVELTKYVSLLLRLGLKMVISILLFFSIGLWIEKKIESKGLILLIGILIGIACGFYLLYKEINNLGKDEKHEKH